MDTIDVEYGTTRTIQLLASHKLTTGTVDLILSNKIRATRIA